MARYRVNKVGSGYMEFVADGGVLVTAVAVDGGGWSIRRSEGDRDARTARTRAAALDELRDYAADVLANPRPVRDSR